MIPVCRDQNYRVAKILQYESLSSRSDSPLVVLQYYRALNFPFGSDDSFLGVDDRPLPAAAS